MNKVLRYLLFSQSFYILALGLLGPIYALYVGSISGAGLLTAAGAYAAFAFAAGIMTLLVSRWEDCVKHKEKLLILSHSLGAAGIFGYLLVGNPLQLLVVQMIIGAAQAVGKPAFDGMYSKNLDKGRFYSEWGLFDSIEYFVIGISAALGGFIVTYFNSFQPLFMIMFTLSLVSIGVSVKLYHLKR